VEWHFIAGGELFISAGVEVVIGVLSAGLMPCEVLKMAVVDRVFANVGGANEGRMAAPDAMMFLACPYALSA